LQLRWIMSRRIPKEEHMQAKELFKLLVREQLGPLLRSEGFRGSRQSWRLEHPSGNAALIYVQRNWYNTADRLEFLINLAVASKVVWDWQLSREPERGPTAKPSALNVNDCPLWLRIGAPSSEGRGEGACWTITSGMRLAPLATSVGQALRGRAIPLLRDHLTDAALCRWLEAHDPQLGWPPETWRLLYLSVLPAAQGLSRRLDQVLAQLQDRAVQDPRPPWLAEHVTDMRQRAMTAAGDAARAGQPPNTTRSLTARLAKYRG
jgi:hypothetical protein